MTAKATVQDKRIMFKNSFQVRALHMVDAHSMQYFYTASAMLVKHRAEFYTWVIQRRSNLLKSMRSWLWNSQWCLFVEQDWGPQVNSKWMRRC